MPELPAFARAAKWAFVYVICHDYPQACPLKVGMSYDPEKRCRDLEKQNEWNLFVARFIGPFDRAAAYGLERRVHKRLASYNTTGEWFDVTSDYAWRMINIEAEAMGLLSA